MPVRVQLRNRHQAGEGTTPKGQTFSKLIPIPRVRVTPPVHQLQSQRGRKAQCLKVKEDTGDLRPHLQLHNSKPMVVAEPDVQELFSSACGIGGRLHESIENFRHFDFSKSRTPMPGTFTPSRTKLSGRKYSAYWRNRLKGPATKKSGN